MTRLADYIHKKIYQDVVLKECKYRQRLDENKYIKMQTLNTVKSLVKSPIVLTGLALSGLLVGQGSRFATLRRLVLLRRILNQVS
ncbi:hypothetical protein PSECIP111854_03513 [Pseudoalteromonas sp. CIP111854]|uniref:Uncharacterized protein n=1 Tax=Pseudoalteromonas holothuriae TaxID=2963714 RepID=A0A9W4R256_9GAMM|nr:hypothetical protein [Pseudoalteromonas sp. CIP111854]CAH9064698.1 hypothetical protein PSECIP111854_03513 [Pseudoalteromonas sp. CIP111854]